MLHSNSAGLCRPLRALVLYTDPVQLAVLGRAPFTGAGDARVIELASMSRLRTADGPPLDARLITAPTSPTAEAAVLALAERAAAGVGPAGRVVFLAHVDDASPWVGALEQIDDVRLIWHPAMTADRTLERLIGLLDAAPLADAIGPHPVYFSSLGGPASADDWRRATRCPLLGMLADTARRRRLQASDPYGGPGALVQPGLAPARLRESKR